MKNNLYKFSLLFLVVLINFNTKLLANEINFEAKNSIEKLILLHIHLELGRRLI